jgi:hypothetical protein
MVAPPDWETRPVAGSDTSITPGCDEDEPLCGWDEDIVLGLAFPALIAR